MKITLWITNIILCILIVACASFGPEGLPTGLTTECPDGQRQVMDCRKAFEQFARTVRFDLGIVQSKVVGVGLGAQSLITLDTITGDLLAHSRQICIDYNNCILSKEEYKEETRYLRHAQLKIRQAAYLSQLSSGSLAEHDPPSPPGVDAGEYETSEDESHNGVLNDLDELNNNIEQLAAVSDTERAISVEGHEEITNPVQLNYSIIVRRKKSSGVGQTKKRYERIEFYPGVQLLSGDQFKLRFETDSDGYVYIVNFDSSGKPQTIFPHREIEMDNRVTAGVLYEVPPDGYYELDTVTGKESIYFIAAPFKIPHVDRLISEPQEGSSEFESRVQSARVRGALDSLTRGIARIVKEEDSGGVGNKQSATQKPEAEREEVSQRLGMTAVRIDFDHL
jgi:hypothetical protein